MPAVSKNTIQNTTQKLESTTPMTTIISTQKFEQHKVNLFQNLLLVNYYSSSHMIAQFFLFHRKQHQCQWLQKLQIQM